MPDFGDRYALATSRSDHDRLRMLCEIHDPHTHELLRRAGLDAGHRLLELGCGLGYFSRWAAAQASHVTALDLSEEHLAEAARMGEAAGLRNIEWRRANIYDNGLPEANFDYTYSRWILVHLNRPVDAMRQLFRLLKPGGLMVCEEPVVDSLYSEPPTDGYNRCPQLAQALSATRKVDYSGGRRLHTWAAEAGFEIVDVRAYQPHYVTGPHKGFWSWTMEAAGPSLVAEAILTEEDLNSVLSAMRVADGDPGIMVAGYRNHQLIARRPC
jgi:cyclopropane fatty-acyl-phospholipid synthase-like methyltransferase